MVEHKIEVTLTPHPWDNKEKPYFWSILEWGKEGGWYNIGCGWSESPLAAYAAAELYYNTNIKNNEEDN